MGKPGIFWVKAYFIAPMPWVTRLLRPHTRVFSERKSLFMLGIGPRSTDQLDQRQFLVEDLFLGYKKKLCSDF